MSGNERSSLKSWFLHEIAVIFLLFSPDSVVLMGLSGLGLGLGMGASVKSGTRNRVFAVTGVDFMM